MNARAHALRLLLILVAVPAQAASVKILDMNIYSYDAAADARYAALTRIVQAINPDILVFQEATNSGGRDSFMGYFASRYPYSFLGGPTNDHARQQILSAYPLSNTTEIYIAGFERPTIYADVDVLSTVPGTELRIYAAHLSAGDATQRLTQATSDAASITTFLTVTPTGRVWYSGDLNCEVGDAPLNKLLEPQTTLTRLTILDPNNSSAVTRPESGRVIDHILYSSTLSGHLSSPFIFNTRTYDPPSSVPAPALPTDSASPVAGENNGTGTITASDHLTLVATIDIPEGNIRLNEVCADPPGTDTGEFVELVGPPGESLSGLSVAVIEGDAESGPGTVARVWSLGAAVVPANGFFVLGDDAVTRKDYSIGASDRIENGTATILLIRSAAISVGQDIDTNDDGVVDLPVGSIEDAVGLSDGGTGDRIYLSAPVFGPVGSSAPPGVAHAPDRVGSWTILNQVAAGEAAPAPTPGLANRPGDFDRDNDVDSTDFATFRAGYAGPDNPTLDARTDLDDDGDTDQEDFGLFQRRLDNP